LEPSERLEGERWSARADLLMSLRRFAHGLPGRPQPAAQRIYDEEVSEHAATFAARLRADISSRLLQSVRAALRRRRRSPSGCCERT